MEMQEVKGVTYSVEHYNQFNETGDKNYFEEIIDAMILDGISGMNDTFRNAIRGLSKDKKRMTILSLLDKDLNLFKRIKALTDKNIGKMDHIKDIILMLREYVKVGEVEKKKFGEVMTPLELVKEMLATLPEEVWSNPDLKWLDPANGTGPYPIMVIYKLMKGLESWEPDAEKRYKHIVENMIYVCELQPKNMFLYMCAVDPFDTYKLNIYTGSFLEGEFDKHMKDVWVVDKFDIIMGNPPYQEHKDGHKKSSSLWDKFVNKSLISILSNLGYLVLVHPGGWRNFGGKFKETQSLLINREIITLNMNTYKDGLNVFGAKTDFDFYCVRNKLNTSIETKITTIDNKVEFSDLKKYPFIPGCNLNEVYSLIAKDGEDRVNILFNSSYHHQRPHMNKQKVDEFKYTCLQNINVKDEISCVWYSNTNERGHFGIPKVVFSRKSSGLFIDYMGEYGLAEDCGAIIDDIENLESIKKAMKNQHFIENIMCFRNNLGDKYNKKVLSTFRKDFWKRFI
jgi:hypothetical protein